MNRLINDVLDLTRIRLGGGIPVERRPADMEQLCRDSIGEFLEQGGA
jgi:signal transduction histidine kinase